MAPVSAVRRAAERVWASNTARWLILLSLDGGIAAASFWTAMMLRFDGRVTTPYAEELPGLILVLAGCRMLANLGFRLHRWSFRFSSLTDGARIGGAGLSGSCLFIAVLYLLEVHGTPRSVVVLELLLSTALMGALRFSPRLAGLYASDLARSFRKGTVRTLIVGAGSAGEMLLRDVQRSGGHDYQVVGFVDDDPGKWGMIVGGRKVLGAIAELPRIAAATHAVQVLIAIPKLQGKRIREILSLCADLKLRFKILPVSFAYLQQRGAAQMIQDLSPDDLLMRDPVTFADGGTPEAMAERTALVTGAGGSIGSEICVQLLKAGVKSLVMVEMNENGMYLLGRRLAREYPGREVSMEVADVRDPGRVRALFRKYRPRDVFHAAAHKHVPLMETAPGEAVKNNILGTRNVALAAHEFGAERFLYISTDKAVRPTSVMGTSKRIGEMVVRAMARRSFTRFCAVRFGNVLGSAGSVVPLFRDQIAAGGPVTVTHPDVRRYFMTISEAVSLVLRAAYGDYSELCVLDMGEQIRILDLARHMITMAGLVPDVDVPIVFTGLRPGEKLYEELLTEEEERQQRVHEKILAAECPAPPEDLDACIEELADAAESGRATRVIEVMRHLVPRYRPHGLTLVDEEEIERADVGSA
ncbi:MAG: polysaccharide biosynthesis protein [Acidobacteriia bacterium]|nr:polysaccharide biosynthesis protein [Terriglobia bacterium]